MVDNKKYNYETYYSKLDSSSENNINWIFNNSIGSKILDVGCSLGVNSSIKLASEGKQVVGLDTDFNAINDILAEVRKEEQNVQINLKYYNSNIFTHNFNNETFDTIILGEFLEQTVNLDELFQKILQLVSERGKIIITVPFGIHDGPKQNRVFYLKSFVDIQSKGIFISKIEFLNGWLGLIYEKSDIEILDVEKLLEISEELYLKKEEKLIWNLIELREESSNKINELEKKFIKEKIIKVKLQNELVEELKKQKKSLNDLKKLSVENKKLAAKFEKLNNQYKSLVNSRLGKITLLYWKIRRARGRRK